MSHELLGENILLDSEDETNGSPLMQVSSGKGDNNMEVDSSTDISSAPLPTSETAFEVFTKLTVGANPPVVNKEAPPDAGEDVKTPRFITQDGVLSVYRPSYGTSAPITIFCLSDKDKVSPEDGWHGNKERQAFFQFLREEQIYESMTEEQKAATLATQVTDVHKELDDLLVELLGLPTSDTRLVRHQGTLPPMMTATPADDDHAIFNILGGKVWMYRYTGKKIKHLGEPKINRGTAIPLCRWRSSGPSPLNGWESEREAWECLEWARHEVNVKRATASGIPPPVHPLDAPPPPPPPPKFVFEREICDYVIKTGLDSYIHSRKHLGPELPGSDTSVQTNVANVFEIAYLHRALEHLTKAAASTCRDLIERDKEKEKRIAHLESIIDSQNRQDKERPRKSTSPRKEIPRVPNSAIRKSGGRTRIFDNKRVNRVITSQRNGHSPPRPTSREPAKKYYKPRGISTRIVGIDLPAVPLRTNHQGSWPETLWLYKFGRYLRHNAPRMTLDRRNFCDVPRRLQEHPEDAPHPLLEWMDDTSDPYELLALDNYDPEYRGLGDLEKVRIKYFNFADPNASFPPVDMQLEHPERYEDVHNGQNKGDNCVGCLGYHYMGYCHIFPLHSDLREVIHRRGGCLLCRAYSHTTRECTKKNPRLCKNGCPSEHHEELCSLDKDDKERQLLHGRH